MSWLGNNWLFWLENSRLCMCWLGNNESCWRENSRLCNVLVGEQLVVLVGE